MHFDGHELYTINKSWMLDLTTFTGYKTKVNKDNELISCTKAFSIEDRDKNCNFVFTKYLDKVPVGVLRKSEAIIRNYYKEALVNV